MDEVTRKRLRKQLEVKLSPTGITANLLQAAMFLVAYELLRGAIIDNTKSFFSSGFNQGELTYSAKYKTDVLDLDAHPYRASCLWLQNQEAFTDVDVEMAMAIRDHRNNIAHELPRILIDPDASVDFSLFAEANRLIAVLGRFWGRIEVDINPDFDNQEVRDEDIVSGPMMLMQHILSIVADSGAVK